jgi:hypothetical protein
MTGKPDTDPWQSLSTIDKLGEVTFPGGHSSLFCNFDERMQVVVFVICSGHLSTFGRIPTSRAPHALENLTSDAHNVGS